MRSIRVGIIGCGYWGPNLVRNFAEVPGCQLVAVSDMRADRLAAVRARYPGVRTFADPNHFAKILQEAAPVVRRPLSPPGVLALRGRQCLGLHQRFGQRIRIAPVAPDLAQVDVVGARRDVSGSA